MCISLHSQIHYQSAGVCEGRCHSSTAPVSAGVTNTSCNPMTLGWHRRRRMHTSRSTRLAWSMSANTLGMRLRATWWGGFLCGYGQPSKRSHLFSCAVVDSEAHG